MPFTFDPTYPQLAAALFRRQRPTPVPNPAILVVNPALADTLGLTLSELTSPEGLAVLGGNAVPPGAEPLALGYAGHQFGHYVPQLGDGRALLLGEVVGKDGLRRDIQLKGAGPTPFSRGGDGRAALGPVLREYLLSEAMAALGVPTTRALAAVTTGLPVFRETVLPGAVLARVAASHLRIGTFQYCAGLRDVPALQQLTDYALARHFPDADVSQGPALALLDRVIAAQASLVAHWMALGFIHGVMNTDNTAISGETLDYGPCAFLDGFDPGHAFSSIDRSGRYAYQNQPQIAHWNLVRLAEALLPLVDSDTDRAVAVLTDHLAAFGPQFEAAYLRHFRAKLGLHQALPEDLKLIEQLLTVMAEWRVDFTLAFRLLSGVPESADLQPVADLYNDPAAFVAWAARWQDRLAREGRNPADVAATMGAANPAFIARNHQVEAALAAAHQGDMAPFERLSRVLARPYTDQPDAADVAVPPGAAQWDYRTFCGT